MKYLIKPSVTLIITAMFVVASVSVVHAFTYEPIQRQQRLVQERTMQQVLPGANNYIPLDIELTGDIIGLYRAELNGEKFGYVVELAMPGYSDDIVMMVGICSVEEKVLGVRILRHLETPGLGALITRESFWRKFDDRPLLPITVVKGGAVENQIDAISSATISTVAVTRGVNQAIAWYVEGGEQQ